ncbi:LysR family transcriptional regulator [Pandoraea thiooxydans]|uniref:LysR family transcriptional regulator n=1 Tax=Pandoraea thiooxydans TaxID=445709 RepID=A0A0G3EXX3_9BURK|nr:LysR family transcriptional regulator [Pandoraea thiooxydans]AKJ69581.1 LysR family transcriptional regulator [Pandoraea thiooxydans]APR97276.1 LysR family transcriptional regulator [Pandoraea thiooxydans]
MEPIAGDRLTGIETFVVAAEAGSFALAAERLKVTRSAVSKTIARLETRLGVRLLVRTTRSQTLTEAGQAFYERCIKALRELDDAQAALEAGHHEPAGRVRVSAPVIFGRRHVAPVLQELMKRHARLEFEISLTDRITDFVDDGIDLAIRSGSIADSSSLVARPLGSQTMIVCAAPAYLAARGKPAGLDDLAAHDGIVYARHGKVFPWSLRDTTGHARELRIAHRLRYDDLEAIAAAAVDGIGLARLPIWLVYDHLQAGRLVRALDEADPVGAATHLVWPHTRYLPLKMRLVIDALLATLPPLLARRAP